MANNNSGKNEKDLVCSFCGKHQDEVERMIIGPGVNICSECIGLCHDLQVAPMSSPLPQIWISTS